MTAHSLPGGTLPLIFKGKDIKPGWMVYGDGGFHPVRLEDGVIRILTRAFAGTFYANAKPDALYLVHIPEDWKEED